jgi:hypothetical protein
MLPYRQRPAAGRKWALAQRGGRQGAHCAGLPASLAHQANSCVLPAALANLG